MVLTSGDISSLIFQRKVRDDLGDFSLDGQMLLILMELDGQKTLGRLAAKTGLSMGAIRGVLAKLVKLGLAEKVEKHIVLADGEFFRYLVDELALAIGPIASVIIEDEVQEMGHDVSNFPGYLAAKLVERLAAEIRREDKKSIFTKNMVNIIAVKGYTNS